jgi:hypothetical protein
MTLVKITKKSYINLKIRYFNQEIQYNDLIYYIYYIVGLFLSQCFLRNFRNICFSAHKRILDIHLAFT